MMTPQQIFDYKLGWKPGFSVRLHSDLHVDGKHWCKRNLEKQQWSFDTWTDVYEHTFRFELEEHAKQFEQLWPRFTNQ